MSDDPSSGNKSYELALYRANACPAEILLPYHLSTSGGKHFLELFMQSKFKHSIWNMDSPLMLSIIMIACTDLIAAFFLAILSALQIVPAYVAIRPVAIVPVSLLLFSFPLYGVIVGSNLAINGGKNWPEKLLGPTSIGLTESGFKLWWEGFAFYNYPNLAVWTDIFYLDLKDDNRLDERSIHFIYQSGFGRRTVELPLRGFSTEEDARLVLSYFARFVLPDNQSEKFREEAKIDFKECLKNLSLNADLAQLSDDLST